MCGQEGVPLVCQICKRAFDVFCRVTVGQPECYLIQMRADLCAKGVRPLRSSLLCSQQVIIRHE
jgi:hypothetical protein